MTTALDLLKEQSATSPDQAFRFNPKQAEVIKLIADAAPGSYTLFGFGGSIGGGKSLMLAQLGLMLSLVYPGSRGLIGRHHLVDLKTTTMEEFYKWCPPQLIFKRNDSECWVELKMPDWPDGIVSKIFFRGLDNWEGKLSEAFSFILIDEASEVDREAADYFLTRLRHRLPQQVERLLNMRCRVCRNIIRGRYCPTDGDTVGDGLKYVFGAASNPFPGWFADWFYKRQLGDAMQLLPGANVHFIPSRMHDNPHLPPGYEATIRAAYASQPELLARMVEGRFDVFVGRIYETFDVDTHTWKGDVPEYWKVLGGLDFGQESASAHWTAGTVAVLTRTNRIIVVDEFKGRGADILDRQGEWMVEMQKKWGDPIGRKIAWKADKSQMVGINLWKKAGFTISQSTGGPGSVDEGIKAVARMLLPDATGLPGLFYLPHLRELEDEFREYRREPETRKVVKVNDDLMDSLRYSVESVNVITGDPAKLFRNALPRVR